MKKSFIITIDTESDNQWDKDSELTTYNAKYIPRFQKLCEKFGFKPVYLTDYSMANNDEFIKFTRERLKSNKCEVGMHPHAWDTPPFYKYDNYEDNKPYLKEYPEQIIYSKLLNLTKELENKFEMKMVSHRAGRWAIDKTYMKILGELGYKVDCSVTPGVNWQNQKGAIEGGSNYVKFPNTSYIIEKSDHILEVPVSVRKMFFMPIRTSNGYKTFIRDIIKSVIGKQVWLRPSINSEAEISCLLKKIEKQDNDYLEFMMHSSEFMPKGSPYFQSEEEIDNLYQDLEILFEKIAQRYEGKTLSEYYKEKINEL